METLDKKHWKTVLDDLSQAIEGRRAEIEVAALGLGDQIAADWVAVRGVAYDPKSDQIDVMLDGLDHVVRHPKTVLARRVMDRIESLVVISAEGEEHIIRFRDPPPLPKM